LGDVSCPAVLVGCGFAGIIIAAATEHPLRTSRLPFLTDVESLSQAIANAMT